MNYIGSPSSTIQLIPSSQGSSQGIVNSSHITPSRTGASVLQGTRSTTIASKTSVSSTTGRVQREGSGQRRSIAGSTASVSRSSPPGSAPQPDTTGVE